MNHYKINLFQKFSKGSYRILLIMLLCSGCKKFVQLDPPKTLIVTPTVFSNEATATSAMRGVYSEMYKTGFADGTLDGITYLSGLSSDELVNYANSPDFQSFYTDNVLPTNSTNTALWSSLYKTVYYSNSIIAGLQSSKGVSATAKTQLTAEAKFIRAFCYFYLINLYGDVPLVLTNDYRVSSTSIRTSSPSVYDQIIADLLEAQKNLPEDYSNEGGQRIRASKWAAIALLARVYLYKKDWASAEANASAVIANSGLFGLENDVNNVFLSTSSEAIWQLMPVIPGQNTNEAPTYILTEFPSKSTLNPSLVNLFDPSDKRRINWIGQMNVGGADYYFPYKYKAELSSTPTEYSMVLRLAEQYLIRAEARAELNNIAGAQSDLNTIRNRAGLGNTTAGDQSSLLNAIELERRFELFTEWGHRWLDLKRTGEIDAVMQVAKGSDWKSTAALYPIPQSEINNDPLLTQNPGY